VLGPKVNMAFLYQACLACKAWGYVAGNQCADCNGLGFVPVPEHALRKSGVVETYSRLAGLAPVEEELDLDFDEERRSKRLF
jgi:hypothetical protein